MSSAVFSSNRYAATKVIAKYLYEHLKIGGLWLDSFGEEVPDTFIIVNGVPTFSNKELFNTIGDVMGRCRRLIWVQNDYKVKVPKFSVRAESPYRSVVRTRADRGLAPMEVWSTVMAGGNTYFNMNLLNFAYTFAPKEQRMFSNRVLYYGSMRENRVVYFDRYFIGLGYPLTISGPNYKFYDRYASKYIVHNVQKEMDVHAYVSEFGMGLYLEDTVSHTEYHSPANRFYEMLSVGVPMVFQPESVPQMKFAGFDVTPYVVKDADAVRDMLPHASDIQKRQRAEWWEQVCVQRMELDINVRKKWEEGQ